MRGENALHARVGGNDRSTRVSLVSQIVDRASDRSHEFFLHALCLGRFLGTAPSDHHPDTAQQDESAKCKRKRPLKVRRPRGQRLEGNRLVSLCLALLRLLRLIPRLPLGESILTDLIQWELVVLSDLGYGLDLATCAVTD